MDQRRPAPVSGNLPSSLTSFVGRRREVADVRRLLGRARLVTLTGVGGVGKTRLSIEAAREARRAFPEGVRFADLAPVTDGARVAQTVATALGVPDQTNRPALEQLVAFVADRELLLVLDNCEHHIRDCAVLADKLLTSCPGLRILATGREVLGLVGEHLFVVHPLSLPDLERPPPLTALAQYDAITLFLDRAAAVVPDFALTEDNYPFVARLCAGLDGVPLGIELAVARLRTMPVHQLAERLEERFRLLTGGSRAAQPRQRTLRALIDWSFELCSEREQTVWARASVFSGGFDLAAAERICAFDDLAPIEVLDLLDHLVARSVLGIEAPERGRVRYRMLETVRQYGRERLAELGATEQLGDRHRDHYLALAERVAADWSGPGQETGLAELRVEHGNLRAALDRSITRRDSGAAQRLVAALRYHWCADGFLSEGRRWLEQALALDPLPTPARAKALWAAAWAALLQGDHLAAQRHLDECAAIAESHGDAVTGASVVSLRATSALFRGRLDDAIALFEAVVAELEGADDTGGVVLALFQLAMARAHRGDDSAPEAAERAVVIGEEHGERWCRSYALWALGFDAWLRGEYAAAQALTRAALRLQRNFSDSVGVALMIELSAWILASRGEVSEAGLMLGAVRALWRTIGTSISAFGPHLARHHARCERSVVESVRADRLRELLEQGGTWDHQQTLDRALGEVHAPTDRKPAATDDVLTRREREVADLIARGMSNRRIAASLTLSTRTIDGHVERILTKLGFGSRSQVAAWVTEQGAARPDR